MSRKKQFLAIPVHQDSTEGYKLEDIIFKKCVSNRQIYVETLTQDIKSVVTGIHWSVKRKDCTMKNCLDFFGLSEISRKESKG